jgi:hypothetical protein
MLKSIFIIAFFMILILLSGCQTGRDRPLHLDTMTIDGVMRGSRTTEARCVDALSSVWVAVGKRAECIHYFAAGLQDHNDVLLVHFHGDVGASRIGSGDMVRVDPRYENFAGQMDKIANKQATETGLPFIWIGRPGTFGSSGFHGDKLQLVNRQLLNAALDKIKNRHSVTAFALSSQSGGGTVVASILTMRQDIRCAVLGAAAASLRKRSMPTVPGPDRIAWAV